VNSIRSYDEWSTLQEIILGTTGLNFSHPIFPIVEEGLDAFSNILKKHNVKVYRPEGFCYNVRDCAFVYGDMIVDAPMKYQDKYVELDTLKPIFQQKMLEGGRWLSAPKPKWDGTNEPLFDAANIARIGKDIIFAVNKTSNRMGRQWLRSLLPDDITIHSVSTFATVSHIDTTIVPLAPYVVMVNSSRITPSTLPSCFLKYDVIWIKEDDLVKTELIDNTPFKETASDWIGMNVLSLDKERVFVQEEQTKLMDKLSKHGFECIPVPLKHTREMCGGLHCCTLDLVRESYLYKY